MIVSSSRELDDNPWWKSQCRKVEAKSRTKSALVFPAPVRKLAQHAESQSWRSQGTNRSFTALEKPRACSMQNSTRISRNWPQIPPEEKRAEKRWWLTSTSQNAATTKDQSSRSKVDRSKSPLPVSAISLTRDSLKSFSILQKYVLRRSISQKLTISLNVACKIHRFINLLPNLCNSPLRSDRSNHNLEMQLLTQPKWHPAPSERSDTYSACCTQQLQDCLHDDSTTARLCQSVVTVECFLALNYGRLQKFNTMECWNEIERQIYTRRDWAGDDDVQHERGLCCEGRIQPWIGV